MGASKSVPQKSIHEFTVKDIKREDVDLSIYKGKVLLVVNVASKCGFTSTNYTQLTQLYNQYKDKGFEILAFPCNQFMKQEPGTSEEAQEFACTRFNAEYPILQRGHPRALSSRYVRGPRKSRTTRVYCMQPYLAFLQEDKFKFFLIDTKDWQEVRVNGPNVAPVYKFLKASKGGFCSSSIKWNFTKFLVDKEGKVIQRYGSTTPPLSIKADIEKALGEN